MKQPRKRDVINVNRMWIAYVGSRCAGYSVGTVLAADRMLALRSARARWPDIRIAFMDELA